MDDLEAVLERLDEPTAARARVALRALLDSTPAAGRRRVSTLEDHDVRAFIAGELAGAAVPRPERHEMAWALGDFFEVAGRASLAALCRDAGIHRAMSTQSVPSGPSAAGAPRQRAMSWSRSLGRGSPTFWSETVHALAQERQVPARVELALTPVRALLDAVGGGVTLTQAGYLPPRLALALDTTFGWSDEYARAVPRGETDVPPLLFLHEHLRGQRLLVTDRRTLRPANPLPGSAEQLWRAVVAPGPRWQSGFEEDGLAVLAATLLRTGELTRNQVRDEMVYLLEAKWQGSRLHSVEDGVHRLELAWFRVGVTLGWWDRRRGLWSAHVRLSGFGRAAAAAVFWAVADAASRTNAAWAWAPRARRSGPPPAGSERRGDGPGGR